MSEVFAAINHRLSEEYTNIEVQSQAAKDRYVNCPPPQDVNVCQYVRCRMLADARFLHQKLSVLKNVNAPTNMLETLVGEKLVPRKSALGTLRAIPSPNERIRGFLSRRESTKPEKPLPTPEQAPSEMPTQAIGEDGSEVVSPPRSSSRACGSEMSLSALQVGQERDREEEKIGDNSAVTNGAATMPIPQASGDSCDEPS